MAEYFLGRFCEEFHKPIRYMAEPVLGRLTSYLWPGNVRELENCMKRAVLLCSGDVILEEHIKLETQKDESSGPQSRDQLMNYLKEKVNELIPDILRLSDENVHANIIEFVEEMLISKALQECGHNQVKAARMLGISRNTLRHRISKYNITPPQ